jgi:hypothetical protein
MSLLRSLVNRIPHGSSCCLGVIAMAMTVCCHAGSPPLKTTGFQGRNMPALAGDCAGPDSSLAYVGGDMGDACDPSLGCPSSPAWRPACCGGKCKFRNCDGITRHCGRPAPNYPVPFPTPLPTTPTLLWYPPMMPHNSLPHYRGSYSYRHAPGLSRTTVSWHPTYVLNALDKLHHVIELPR